MCNLGKFHKFHYTDEAKNIEMYGSELPPEYDLSKITAKIHILYGTNDLITPPKVSVTALKSIPYLIHLYNAIISEYSADFGKADVEQCNSEQVPWIQSHRFHVWPKFETNQQENIQRNEISNIVPSSPTDFHWI